jgi:hypothetical protein
VHYQTGSWVIEQPVWLTVEAHRHLQKWQLSPPYLAVIGLSKDDQIVPILEPTLFADVACLEWHGHQKVQPMTSSLRD